MARSIHKPWLKLWVQGILNENNNNDSTTNENISIINSNNRNKNNQNSTITTTRSNNHHKNVSDIVNKNYINQCYYYLNRKKNIFLKNKIVCNK